MPSIHVRTTAMVKSPSRPLHVGLLLAFVYFARGLSLAQDPTGAPDRLTDQLETARDEFANKRARYRDAIEECLVRLERDIQRNRSPELSRVYDAEVRAFRARGAAPALARTKAYEKFWSKAQRDLIEAMSALERLLVESRRRTLTAESATAVASIDTELEALRAAWIVPGQPPPTVELLATSESPSSSVWWYTMDDPGLKWVEPDFEGPGWREGRAGFGSPRVANLSIGTTWTREAVQARLEVLQRIGDRFVARLTLTGPRGSHDLPAFGVVSADRLTLEEVNRGALRIVSRGRIDGDSWRYEFRGRGGGGAERYGHSEMKPR
jgi:hypothetical protein